MRYLFKMTVVIFTFGGRLLRRISRRAVAALIRHSVDYDVFRERRRFRLEWELAIFPIF